MIQTAIKFNGLEKETLTGMIANQMKKSYMKFTQNFLMLEPILLRQILLIRMRYRKWTMVLRILFMRSTMRQQK